MAEILFDGLLSLPLYPKMSEGDVDHVIEALRGILIAARGNASQQRMVECNA
jgi:dTDP-4-amino-4,6-dideoxygalactose transaminase